MVTAGHCLMVTMSQLTRALTTHHGSLPPGLSQLTGPGLSRPGLPRPRTRPLSA